VVGPFLLLALVAWWIRHCFPFDRGSWRQMRMAALIGGCAFIGHGLFDVSGHRFGSLWPALFCAATALHPRERTGRSRLLANIFRGLGLSFLGVGIWWSLSLTGYIDSANSATLRGLLVRADQASERENYQEMRTLLNRAFPIAPIYWELYFKRGVAEAGLYEPRTLVERDFAIARHLYPFWAELYLKEGQVWLAVGEPDLAFDLWQHGLAPLRAEGPRLYEQIFSVVKDSPDLVDRWRDLGHNDKQCRIIMLRSVDPMGFRIELNRLLEEDPQLNGFSADERRMIFDTWYQKGDKLALAETLRAHPDWEKIGWRKLALIFADYQDYRQAFETTRRFIPPPRTVDPGSETMETLQSRFRLNVTPATGLALARAEIRDGRVDDALETLKVVAGLPDHPREILWLESELWARKGSWPQAWRAIFEYDNARR
jgi:tetratricopeptide (TPR) repeat protein